MDITFFRTHALTRGLTHAQLERLNGLLQEGTFTAGAEICVEGAMSRGLIMLKGGTVEVTKKLPTGGERVLAQLEAPTVLGEMELVGQMPSAATVKAVGEVTALVLPTEAFDELVDAGDPTVSKLMRNIARVLSQRLVETNERMVTLLDPQQVDQFHAAQGEVQTHWGR